jgi:hypothetical protein
MKFGFCLSLLLMALVETTSAQDLAGTEATPTPAGDKLEAAATEYTVRGGTPEQESVLRAQIRMMQPSVLPLRITFVPHAQYLYAARMFLLRVPRGMVSLMFTHLASRSVFIDSDRYWNDDSLGYWIAHELGHLATNSAREDEAERAARDYRRRLKDARKRDAHD